MLQAYSDYYYESDNIPHPLSQPGELDEQTATID